MGWRVAYGGGVYVGFLAGTLVVGAAFAQSAPDAGQLLRDQPKPPTVAPSQPLKMAPPTLPRVEPDTGPKIQVNGFSIRGALLISEAELTAQLQSAIGQELSFAQIQNLADALIGYYAKRGYLARVIVPPQSIKDGIVTLQVIEGKRGSLRIDNQGKRIDSARVQRMIDYRLAAGSAMDIGALGEAMNIINEQPGIAAKTTLAPGQGEAEIDLVVSATEKPLVGYALSVNNYGSKGTGLEQVNGAVTLANPSGHFDTATFMVNANRGSTYGRADYSLAAGNSGLRLGVNISQMDYRVVQSEFAALDSRGSARTAGLVASYPLARRSDMDLSLTASIDSKHLVDLTVSGETGNRSVNVANFGISGSTKGHFGGAGVASFGSTLSVGDTDQRNASARASDLATRQTQGSFTKVGYHLAYLQDIAGKWNVNATLRGQFAASNLESSERFSLGGPSAIRAYPVGEASGDDGWLASLTLSHRTGDNLATKLFLDAGGIQQNHSLWNNWNAGRPGLDNIYQLAGAGLGVDWLVNSKILVSAIFASPIGTNPGRDAQGQDSDGGHGPRGWLAISVQF